MTEPMDVIDALLERARAVYPYLRSPAINTGENGGLEVEWWIGDRSLTLFVDGESVSYLRSWGPDMVTDMEDGPLGPDDLPRHWRWLIQDEENK